MLFIRFCLGLTGRLPVRVYLLFFFFGTLAIVSPLASDCDQPWLLEMSQEGDQFSVDMVLRLGQNALLLVIFGRFLLDGPFASRFFRVRLWWSFLAACFSRMHRFLHILLSDSFTLFGEEGELLFS